MHTGPLYTLAVLALLVAEALSYQKVDFWESWRAVDNTEPEFLIRFQCTEYEPVLTYNMTSVDLKGTKISYLYALEDENGDTIEQKIDREKYSEFYFVSKTNTVNLEFTLENKSYNKNIVGDKCAIYVKADTDMEDLQKNGVEFSFADVQKHWYQSYFEDHPSEMQNVHQFELNVEDGKPTIMELDVEKEDLIGDKYYQYLIARVPSEINSDDQSGIIYTIYSCINSIPTDLYDKIKNNEKITTKNCISIIDSSNGNDKNNTEVNYIQQTVRGFGHVNCNTDEEYKTENCIADFPVQDENVGYQLFYIFQQTGKTTVSSMYMSSFIYEKLQLRNVTYIKPQTDISHRYILHTELDYKKEKYDTYKIESYVPNYSIALCLKGCVDTNDKEDPLYCNKELYKLLKNSDTSLDIETTASSKISLESTTPFGPPEMDNFVKFNKNQNICIYKEVEMNKLLPMPMGITIFGNSTSFISYSCTILSLTADNEYPSISFFSKYNPGCFEIPILNSVNMSTSSDTKSGSNTKLKALNSSQYYSLGNVYSSDSDDTNTTSDDITVSTTNKTLVISIIIKDYDKTKYGPSKQKLPVVNLVTCELNNNGNYINMCDVNSNSSYSVMGINVLNLNSYSKSLLGNLYLIKDKDLKYDDAGARIVMRVTDIKELKRYSPFTVINSAYTGINFVDMGEDSDKRPLGVKLFNGSKDQIHICFSANKIGTCTYKCATNLAGNWTIYNKYEECINKDSSYEYCDGNKYTICKTMDKGNSGYINLYDVYGDVLYYNITSNNTDNNNESSLKPKYLSMVFGKNTDSTDSQKIINYACAFLVDEKNQTYCLDIPRTKTDSTKYVNENDNRKVNYSIDNKTKSSGGIQSKVSCKLSFKRPVLKKCNVDDKGGEKATDDYISDESSFKYYVYKYTNTTITDEEKKSLFACYVEYSGEFTLEKEITEGIKCKSDKNGDTECSFNIQLSRDKGTYVLLAKEYYKDITQIYEPFVINPLELPDELIILMTFALFMLVVTIGFIIFVLVLMKKKRQVQQLSQEQQKEESSQLQ